MRLVSKILVTLGIFAGVVSSVTLTSCGPQEEAHTHTFAEEWTSDDTHHWHEATCELAVKEIVMLNIHGIVVKLLPLKDAKLMV